MEAYCVALELKKQYQDLKSGPHGRVLKDIDDIETINIELEHSVAKLFQVNENLHKENEHLKQTSKYLFDSIKLTRTQTKGNSDSLIVQLNKKSIENADLKAQFQDKRNINAQMRNLLNKMKGKFVDTKFEKPSIVRQPNAFRFQNPSVMGKPSPFSNSFERQLFSKPRFHPKTNVKKDLSKPVTPQILPPKENEKQAVKNSNVIKPGMYRINTKSTHTRTPQLPQTFRNTNPRMSTSTRVIHKTSVSKPQLRGTQMKEMVMPNNSQVMLKKTESKTSNAKVVCVTYGKSVFNSNHDACVSKFINDVNDRTKKSKNPLSINSEVTLGCYMRKIVRHGLGGLRNNVHQDIYGNLRNDLLTGTHASDLYTIALQKSPTPICFIVKASPTQAWLWHHRLSHLNFDTINLLSKIDIMNGLPKLKYVKDQLCSSYEMGKAKRGTFKTKTVPSSKVRLHPLHMDLCGHIWVESINRKKYILMIQRGLQAQAINVRTDKGTEFVTKTIQTYFKEEGISHQMTIARTTEQNSVIVKMDDPNITMEEYIRLEEEKAQKRGKVFNWETAKYGKICSLNNEIDFRVSFDDSDDEDYTPTVSCIDDLDFFKDFKNEFPAIVYNKAQTSKSDLLTEPILSSQHIDEFNLKDKTSLFECDEEEQNILNFNDLFPFNVIYPNDSKPDKDNDDDKVDIEHSSGDLSVK
ncbi:retrovirus-related pol polyprotein from transposon TNT 1-94 [Tanacetum coccineum]